MTVREKHGARYQERVREVERVREKKKKHDKNAKEKEEVRRGRKGQGEKLRKRQHKSK